MLRNPERRKRNLIIGGVLVLLAIVSGIWGRQKADYLAMPDKVDRIVIHKVGEETKLDQAQVREVYDMLKHAKIEKSESYDKITEEHYPETYSIHLYYGKKVQEIYHLLPDGRIYDPNRGEAHTFQQPIGKDLLSIIKKK
ncbi:hypothetical protein SAMN02910358_01324 [Lachnospiraceae bacterium XBB1006]|nr:hypothetical protein SAMN02910358_01324 [Lachnospiraceae bacterium XBB1006]